ncbi:hypothetical protein R1flu_017464 [Riccia fluitans]|uniref:Uncharacterized protein n=1 Tax=Riccia fluitans TaxID=41844 RepID=A0ABD1ZD19_9MARC
MAGHRRSLSEESTGNSFLSIASSTIPDNSPLSPSPNLDSDISDILLAIQHVRQYYDGQNKSKALNSTAANIKWLIDHADLNEEIQSQKKLDIGDILSAVKKVRQYFDGDNNCEEALNSTAADIKWLTEQAGVNEQFPLQTKRDGKQNLTCLFCHGEMEGENVRYQFCLPCWTATRFWLKY